MSSVSKRRKEGSRTKIKLCTIVTLWCCPLGNKCGAALTLAQHNLTVVNNSKTSMGDHKEFLKRITKSLYYGQLPTLPCLSLPVTEISCELWSVSQRGRSLRRLHADAAAGIARSACVSPCALVLAILYLERLNSCNPDYLSAAAPADLFLVSLMVGNKFLQDDGEDDDVLCSEWASSGGIELDHLKKLEVEFLNAIEWNVFVSDRSFEAGLAWLERQVALRQARRRGFFTYGDLAAAGAAPLAGPLRAAAAAALSLALGYVTGVAALLTSTLVLSHAWLPALGYVAARTSLVSPDTNIITHSLRPAVPYVNNSTLPPGSSLDLAERTVGEDLACCTKWAEYRDSTEPKKSWYDAIVVYDWKSFEPWWSKTSVLNWLYQSSLVDPMQRWLDQMNEYADFFARDFGDSVVDRKCNGYVKTGGHQRCVRQWLNLSKLGALVATVSDR